MTQLMLPSKTSRKHVCPSRQIKKGHRFTSFWTIFIPVPEHRRESGLTGLWRSGAAPGFRAVEGERPCLHTTNTLSPVRPITAEPEALPGS